MHPDDTNRNTDAAETGEIWTCPMHPEVQKKEPGRCPKCNMHLVKRAR